ncbi:MAG: signal peptide peptidase SppA [Gammaproteobacteria bacterium]|nr:signal peptide peptidase SppA [Gammaproteobacteria bacterium]
MSHPDYETIVNKLAFAAITEQRRARRWRIFFLFLFFIYLTPILILTLDLGSGYSGDEENGESGHTAVVKLSGVIASGEDAGSENVIAGLEAAFKHENTKAVIVEINSPGGSPVESSYIYNEINRLRDKHEVIPVYAVVADIAASGGYFVASAADKIYVNRSSLIGSIGVRMDNFGFVELMKKIGIERRLLTAGENKGLLDPFLPEDEQQKAHIQAMLNEVHEHFIKAVRDGRGQRLVEQEGLFSGLIWTGEKAIELGLVDNFGSSKTVAREVVKAEKLVDFTPKSALVERLADRLGASFSAGFARFFTPDIY